MRNKEHAGFLSAGQVKSMFNLTEWQLSLRIKNDGFPAHWFQAAEFGSPRYWRQEDINKILEGKGGASVKHDLLRQWNRSVRLIREEAANELM